ncbi:hypothetical protein [Kitasatospora sp. NPDC008115]|uniref:hypothetical protein n=1 Tax=Kitasatospora sp. NPDC008115 TaxID=3364022 RepID=UPI0036E945BE
MDNPSPEKKRSELGPWELREVLLARVNELWALLSEVEQRHGGPQDAEGLFSQAFNELQEAKKALSHRGHSIYKKGSHLTVGQIHLDAAHNLLLRLSGPDEVIPMMPGVLALVQDQLPASDPRRVKVEQINQELLKTGMLASSSLEAVLDAVSVARQAGIRETLRLRSFVNIVGWVAVILFGAAVWIGILGMLKDDILPLCFTPPVGLGEAGYVVVCPSGMDPDPKYPDVDANLAAATSPSDYLLIEIVGLVAAGIAAATSLRRIRGSATPYNVPVALALLKLPMGALTAVLGLLLMRGGFVPGLSALDSSAQIIAWAIVFGYSQQLFTRLVDTQAQSLVNAVGASNAPSTPPPPPPPAPPAP